MNLDHLHYFETIARLQHYGQAAQALHISQPALNYAVTQLEEELGAPLFERQGRGVRLTRYGELFQQSVNTSLHGLDTGVRTIQELAQGGGLVLLGCVRKLAADRAPFLMRDFLSQEENQGVRFELHTATGFTADLLDMVADERLDIALVNHPGDPVVFECVPFANAPFVVIAPEGHPLAQYQETGIALADTLSYPYVCFTPRSGLRKRIDELFRRIGGEPQIAYEVEEDSVVAGMTEAGFGIAVLLDHPELHYRRLAVIPILAPDPARTAYLVRKRMAVRPAAAERFWEYCVNTLTQPHPQNQTDHHD